MTNNRSRTRPWLAMLILSMAVGASAASWKEKVLYSFQGGNNDGAVPAGGVVFDAAGNLYGATGQGFGFCAPIECGSVFELSPPLKQGGPWTETVLHVFAGHSQGDGNTPDGGVIIDSSGNLYGTTAYGGTGNCILLGTAVGCGTVWELSPPKPKGGKWTYATLYSFPTSKQGYVPNGNLVLDSAGNLYGATMFGGSKGTTCNGFYGGQCGVVFELSPPKQKGGKWTEVVLQGFAGIANGQNQGDGAQPNGGLVLNSKSAIYGTTYIGGYNCPHNSNQGCGTAFELKPPAKKGGAWTEKILRRFPLSEANPAAGMTFDEAGHLFGTNAGVIFRLAPPSTKSGHWKETILYTFNQNVYDPQSALIFDTIGNLYGTAGYGSNGFRHGSVFRLQRPNTSHGPWNLGVLYGFAGSPDGAYPAATLTSDKHGRLFSTTQGGGTGTSCSEYCGTVFEAWP